MSRQWRLKSHRCLRPKIRSNLQGYEFKPVRVSVGSETSLDTQPFAHFQLNAKTPVATVDFGTERAGYPFFVVGHVNQPVQVEVKYAEQFNALNQSYSDGPYPWAPGLTNCFRVETFNVTQSGRIVSRLIQGGQRWHSFKILNPSSILITEVGLVATIDPRDTDQVPGQFSCDDSILNDIWALGVRASLGACVAKESQGPVWEVDLHDGVHIRSTAPSHSLSASQHATYTLEFETKIIRGGLWWSVVRKLRYETKVYPADYSTGLPPLFSLRSTSAACWRATRGN